MAARPAAAAAAPAGAAPLSGLWGGRWFASAPLDVAKEVDTVNELFAAARDEIEYAKEEAETVYFNESVGEAKKAVEACLGRWEALLAALPEEERARVVRSMGLKISQLQAEYDEVAKLHLEDH
ncbi:hypothetical protein HYH02_000271 [Chlamydomonas schloesseri]|uniref:Uncharacterized protein n=1 Tax=Chlamydomonas schloesseri TaxID=2026947 RepID=A0A835WMW5_9CHLO|nr:hypothetical protein HYH02_000271 [Chlamydomonas schloesseri]|eukprot:KAG2450169.1 hypothetical protein HYH02_000271 [Chlamydomonas schloesseri]